MNKNPLLLFTNFPLELRAAFISPEDIPDEMPWRQYDVDLKSFNYKTYELDEIISTFYIFNPKQKQELKPFFKYFIRIRNVSVHGAFTSFQSYDLDRILYLAAKVFFIVLNGTSLFDHKRKY